MKSNILLFWVAALLSGCAAMSSSTTGNHLVGTYRAISVQGVPDGEAPVDVWGKEPPGYLVITPQRLTVVLTAQNRKLPAGPVPTPQELIASFVTQAAYTGPYRLEGNQLITKVQASSYATWAGTEQVREFKLEGNRLHLATPRGPIPSMPGKTGRTYVVFEKVE